MKALKTDNLTGITKEVEIKEIPIDKIKLTEQLSVEQQLADLQQVITELTTILNDKGIAP